MRIAYVFGISLVFEDGFYTIYNCSNEGIWRNLLTKSIEIGQITHELVLACLLGKNASITHLTLNFSVFLTIELFDNGEVDGRIWNHISEL